MREEAYRIYISDVLKGLAGAQIRYIDIVNPGRKIENPDEKAEEIKEGIKDKLRRIGGNNGRI